MAIMDLFSKREKRLKGEMPDVYKYDNIPNTLRTQIIYIWQDTIGGPNEYDQQYVGTRGLYKFIVEILCREYGLFKLSENLINGIRNYYIELSNFLLKEDNNDRVIDAIELSFKLIDRHTRQYEFLNRQSASEMADEAIEELNSRFIEHGIGFHYSDGKIIRINSMFIHSELIKPALILLHGKEFHGAQVEFLKAHEHFRKRHYKESLNECVKSLESVMKSICTKHKWNIQPNATCNTLIKCCFENGLIPSFWEQQFNSLRSSLESGAPPARNKLGGHGQGIEITDAPQHLVAYVLHMTASAIVFLVESERALK